MSDRGNRRHPARAVPRIVSSLLLLLQSPLPIHDAAAHPNHPGKWTTTATNPTWPATAVNLVLLPGSPSNHHSRILWWDHHAEPTVTGGLWGWSPASDASVNDGNFPGSNFVNLQLESLPSVNGQPANIFCSGQTLLEDGQLLVTGGNELFEIGIRSAVLFNPAADSNGAWALPDSMKYRRWYPNNTLLPDGRVVTVTGNSYGHYATVGGLCDASPDSTTRMLQRFGVTTNSAWEDSVVPRGATSPFGPLEATSDAAVTDLGSSSMLLFGGRNGSGTLLNNATRIKRERDVFGSDYAFQWTTLSADPFGDTPPSARTGATVVAFGSLGDILVFGGLEQSQVSSGAWRGRISGNTIKWKQLSPSGDALPALHGHNAIYDGEFNRVYVFGGSSTASETPTNRDVYSLQLGALPTSDTLNVTKANASTATGEAPPGPRSYGTLTYFSNSQAGMPGHESFRHQRALLFGGHTVAGSLADTLHAMWISGPTTVTWDRIDPDASPAQRPSGRAHHAASIDKFAQWLIMSGGETTAGASTAEVWAFDLTCGVNGHCDTDGSNHWEALPSLRLPVRGHVASVMGPEPAFPRLPEVYTPGSGSTGTWQTLSSAPHWQEWYSFGFAAPRRPTDPAGSDSLRVFYAGPEVGSPTLHLSRSTPNWTTMTTGTANFLAGSAVMYRPGKVMKCGTRDTGGILPSEVYGRTAVINLKDSVATWAEAATADSMIARRNHNLVILPTGEVIVVGGARYGGNGESTDDNCVKTPQIWNPDTLTAGHWYGQETSGIRFDASSVRRHYHSTAILLPDARVLVAGGAFDTTMQRRVDIYSPYYLFNGNTGPRTRPQILGTATRVSYGERFVLRMAAADVNLAKVSLIRPGATTHGFDQNQRFVPATFSAMAHQVSGEYRYLVTAPADSLDAPPGDYLLFALDSAGTPSIATWIQLRRTNLDSTATTTVSDLAKVCSHGTWAELEWSTPQGDAGGQIKTPIQKYDLRWRSSHMSSWADFQGANAAAHTPAAALDPDATATSSTSVYNLTPDATYYFRFASKDFRSGSGNWSAMSNELVFTSYDEECGGSGGGGGGCCHEGASARQARGLWARRPGGSASDPDYLENTLLPNVEPDHPTTDLLRLPYGPKWSSSGARVRLSRAGSLATRFSRVRLLGVAVPEGEDAFTAGDRILTGSLAMPASVRNADGRDLTASFANGSAFEGHVGDTLVVEFADGTPGRIALESSRAQLVARPIRTGIDIQCETAQGWETVAHHDPRALQSDALHDVPDASRLRLVFRGDHLLHGIARFVPGATAVVTPYEPASVTHSRIGEVGQTLAGDGALVAPGEYMVAQFAAPAEQGPTFEWFLEVVGEHKAVAVSGSSSIRPGQTSGQPLRFALDQNRPNPFGGETLIGFELPLRSMVRLEVFDLLGRRVAVLANASYEPGRYSIRWDRRGTKGTRVPAGVYTYRYTAGEHREQRRLIVFP